MVKFFNEEEAARIVEAIKEAELNTSGEIRVHLQKRCWGNILKGAGSAFHRLKMDETELRNGVLIYIVPSKHQFAIIGDKGINEKVPDDFWEEVKELMQAYFRKNRFAEGVCEGVRLSGEKLKEHFPWQDDDENELPDEISYG